jgi:hypothetical protein
VSDKERMVQRLKLIEAAAGLGLTAWCLWSMIPEHRRQEWRMRMLLEARTWAGKAASRTGAASMRAELATGHQEYTIPYALSLTREHLAAMYDRARGVTP